MQRLSKTTDSRSSPSAPAVCARAMLDGMPQVMWHIRRHMRRNRTHGLSIPAFRTLVLLERFPHASLSCIADNLGASPPTASRIVAGLVRKGMVRRAVCEDDRRQVALLLSAAGRAVLAKAEEGTLDELAQKLDALSPAERETISRAMNHLKVVFAFESAPAAEAAES